MDILKIQLKKLSTFTYILLFLLIVAVISNLNFRWEGIRVIVRVYIFLFSFYVIFNFSEIDIDTLKKEYFERYGSKGEFFLFFITRISPFIIIYVTVIIFTMVYYLGSGDWPMRPLLALLDGRFSNTVVYSLILLVILKIRRSPRVTVPLFILLSILYYILYRFVYYYSPTGVPTSLLKWANFAIVSFFLIYEFFYNKKNIKKIILSVLMLSTFLYFAVFSIIMGVYNFSSPQSFPKIRSSLVLLRMGYSFPLKELERYIAAKHASDLLKKYIFYSRTYNKKITFTAGEWEELVSSSSLDRIEIISLYLIENKIMLPFKKILSAAVNRSIKWGSRLMEAKEFIRYVSLFYKDHKKELLSLYHRENVYYKIWTLKVIGNSGDWDSIPFLINNLTAIDDRVSQSAFLAIKSITGLDLRGKNRLRINSPLLIKAYREYYAYPGIRN